MGFRLRRSARLGPLRFNFSSCGLSSISIGGRGASFNIPVNLRGGPRTTVVLPDTGLSWSVEHTPDRPAAIPAGVAEGLPNSRRLRVSRQVAWPVGRPAALCHRAGMHEPKSSAITSSLVLAADDPAALAQFYGALLGVAPQPGLSAAHWRVPWPTGRGLEVYAPSQNRPQPRQRGRLALCLQRQADGSSGALAALQAWITTALELGASVGDPPRQEPFVAEAWLLDPEGNRLLLLLLP